MAAPATEDTNDLARLVATLRSAWLLVLAITVAGALGALGLSYVQSPRYDSEATILYAPSGLDADADSARADREVTTAVDLIEAEAVLAPVARRLGETTADLREQVEVARREGADTITIRATGGSAEEARQRAALVSAGFRAYSRSLQQRQIDGRIASYERQIGALQASPAEADQETVRALRTQLNLVEAERGLANGNFVEGDAAVLPAGPYAPKPIRNALLGAVAGLMLGLGTALLRSRLDHKLTSIDDIEAAYGVPALGALPRPTDGERRADGTIVGDFSGSTPLVEACRGVRANLTLYGLRGEDLRVIAITSASPGEGKTTLTANLALAVASSGRSVLVISADLRLPSLHRFFDDNPTGAGLLEVLAGDMPLVEATATPSLNGAGAGGGRLHVLANARRFRDPAPLFESQAMKTLLDEARQSYDYVLIDSPPILGAPEASIVARLADGAIVVGRAGTLSREDVRHTLLRLEHAGVRPLGVVVSGVTSTREAYGYGLTA